MKGELLEMQIAFIFIGIFLIFVGFVSKTQNAGDMINGFNSRKHDKEKVSKILGNNFLAIGFSVLILISTTFIIKDINKTILQTIIIVILLFGIGITLFKIEKNGKIKPRK